MLKKFLFIAILILVACTNPDEKAKQLGFKDLDEQREAYSKGFMTSSSWLAYKEGLEKAELEKKLKQEEEKRKWEELRETARKNAIEKYGEIGGFCSDENGYYVDVFGIFTGANSINKYALELKSRRPCFKGSITGMSTDRTYDKKTHQSAEITSVDFERKIICEQFDTSLRYNAVNLPANRLYFVAGEFEEVFFGSDGIGLIFMRDCKIIEHK